MIDKPTYKELEQRVNMLEENYRNLIENIPIGISISTPEGKLIEANQAMMKMFGCTSMEDFMQAEADEYWCSSEDREQFVRLLKGGMVKEFEAQFRRKDETLFWGSLTTIGRTIGKEIRFFNSFSNITRRKESEEEKKKLETQLIRAQKMEAIGTLAGGIAHDFNNILYPIIGYTEMVMDAHPAESKTRTNLENVFKATNRAKELIQQILTFTREDNQELTPLKAQFIIKEALKLLRASIPKNIEIYQDISSDCSHILGNPIQIHQVIVNLCTNAYHAMEVTGGILEVSLNEVSIGLDEFCDKIDIKPGKYVRLTVSDTGHGMNPDVLDRIFDPYFTTKTSGKGTGMGLSVSHGIVKSHGGTMMVYSEPGKGSTFHVYLPLIELVTDQTEIVLTENLPKGKESILLVDDEKENVYLMQKTLELLGYQVTARFAAKDVLADFRSRPEVFDLVVTDMHMPAMTGDQLSKELLRIRPDIPIILCTGFSEQITENKANAIGIKKFVMKPVGKSQLAKIIRSVLDQAKEK